MSKYLEKKISLQYIFWRLNSVGSLKKVNTFKTVKLQLVSFLLV